ncbi:hypothetical protein SAMN05660841_03286 [Sphingobacterium nematocida]|uniref:Uncharacterized protein n=1 Tax=Sphingobacterium nematocida TaxID=1513896 RepID=A0A1T5FI63_9SPHI|nr:hypothetical protein [Sphingobacterium nematocida]SKB95904.1 hypothetical protein SAMN05660841_03286 [Sphingobacterium nematocida]
MFRFKRLSQLFKSGKYRLSNRCGRDHATIISFKKRDDGYMYGMTVDFATRTFSVSRSSAIGESKRECTAYLSYDLLTKAGKEMVKLYDDGNLEDGYLEFQIFMYIIGNLFL